MSKTKSRATFKKTFLIEIPYFSEPEKRADVRSGLVIASTALEAQSAAEGLLRSASRLYAVITGNAPRSLTELANLEGEALLEAAGLWVGALRIRETSGIPSLEELVLGEPRTSSSHKRLPSTVIAPEADLDAQKIEVPF
ncbi:MAG: hypothetical protein IPQ24_11345 [Anaeromyxobacter sp.]|nr:hypothetical protein [Anaeromyxobacter sp.]